MTELKKFIFKDLPIRGQLVKLTDGWQQLLQRQQPPLAPPVQQLLGEMSAAALLMQSNIKFNGALVLQIFGDAALKMAVVEVQPNLAFRATAKVIGEIAADASLAEIANQRGEGRCAITLDPKDRLPGQQPYQGIVSLDNEIDNIAMPATTLAQALENYLHQSEQLDSLLVLAANQNTAAGLLIQRLPQSQQQIETEQQLDEDFNRISILAKSLTSAELLDLDAVSILQRLFWQEDIELFAEQEQREPHFACSCSREKVGNMLLSLGNDEVQDILIEQPIIAINCDFCGQLYQFDAVDVQQLFTAATTSTAQGLQ